MKEKRNYYSLLIGKHEGKKPLGRLRCRWEDNIKMNLKLKGCKQYQCGSRYGQIAGRREHGSGTSDSIKGREILEQLRNY